MIKRKAEQEGLRQTGIYYRDKETTKKRIAEERKAKPGCRIVMVTIPDSKYSRSCDISEGYAAYADKVYTAYGMAERSKNTIGMHQENMDNIKLEYEAQVNAQINKYRTACDLLTEANEIIKGGEKIGS